MNLAKLIAVICISVVSLSAIAHGPKHDHKKKNHQECCEKPHNCTDKNDHHKKHDHKKHHKHGKKHGHKNDCHKGGEYKKHDHDKRDKKDDDSSVEVSYKGKKAEVSIEIRK